MTRIKRAAAAVLCASGLAVAVPEVMTARPAAPAASVATQPSTWCLSGVRRVQVERRHTPGHRLYAVRKTWIAFTTAGVAPCANSRFSAAPA